ncbi:cell division protein FtsQ/DivIB [Bacillus salitolerans]|uniref:Cell division protein DivIB n=1 Tax=Bacillus salitolerans TaxID=1437434 RepID=A0ABW4LKU4_9BACI
MNRSKVVTLEDRIPKLKTQRRQKANRRLILYVSMFFLLIIGILYFQSPLSHVKTIEVIGNRHISSEEIINLSGISSETSFWNIQKHKIISHIKKKNVQIKDVSITKEFPNKIVISVTELIRVGYCIQDGHYDPILEDGTILSSSEGSTVPSDAPILMNWKSGAELQEMAFELSLLSKEISGLISEIHHTPSDTDDLHITLFMNDGREVSSTIRDFAKKMSAYPSIASQLDKDLKGIIHLEVAYYFEAYETEAAEQTEMEEVKENESEG